MTRSVRLLLAIFSSAVGVLVLSTISRRALGLPSYPVRLDVWADDWRLAGLHLAGHILIASGCLALSALLLYVGWVGGADRAPAYTFPSILGLLATLFTFFAVASLTSIASLWTSLPWGHGVLYVISGTITWALWITLFKQRRSIMRILEALGEALQGGK